MPRSSSATGRNAARYRSSSAGSRSRARSAVTWSSSLRQSSTVDEVAAGEFRRPPGQVVDDDRPEMGLAELGVGLADLGVAFFDDLQVPPAVLAGDAGEAAEAIERWEQ